MQCTGKSAYIYCLPDRQKATKASVLIAYITDTINHLLLIRSTFKYRPDQNKKSNYKFKIMKMWL